MSALVPSDPDRLFTWVDVDERLTELAMADKWPDWLLEVDPWWDCLRLITSRSPTEPELHTWLEESFGPGSVHDGETGPALVLDGPMNQPPEALPLEIIRSDSSNPPRRSPRLRERHISRHLAHPLPRPSHHRFTGDVQIMAFHSFKGGVGRTLHAVAMADQLALAGRRVLLVDADLEAPGISWMYRSQGGQMDFSYEDFLATVHGSLEESNSKAVELAASYLPNQEIGRYPGSGAVTVMPANRNRILAPPRIDPADLITPDRSMYVVSEALAELAAEVSAEIVIVDLRAGSSELSSPLLLDPRVQRVFVTTVSSQSLDGTLKLIQQLGHRAPSCQGIDPVSSAVITQYRPDAHKKQVEEAVTGLASALTESVVLTGISADETEGVDTSVLTAPVLSPFHDELLALPQTWDGVMRAVDRSGLKEALARVAPDTPGTDVQRNEPEQTDQQVRQVQQQRQSLNKVAHGLVYAENSGMASAAGFLTTDPLRRLIGDHRTEAPIALILGAKGSGKTFTYAQACAAGDWQSFSEASGVNGVSIQLPILPVLEPVNLNQGEGPTTQTLRDRFCERTGGRSKNALDMKDVLEQALTQLPSDQTLAWRSMWLRVLAMTAGLDLSDRSPEEALVELGSRHPAVFVIDGLEDLVQALDSDSKRTALRTLFIDTLNWLHTLRGKPLGLIVFARSDLVDFAVRQNSGQLKDRYGSYALRWDRTEALRLAIWVASQADAISEPDQDIADISEEEAARLLTPLWGWKMGSAQSKEARSHLWVPAALTDYNEQVQARDVVVFLLEAAGRSIENKDGRWMDRVLVPAAMRKALEPCSLQKIRAIEVESPDIGRLLGRLQEFGSGVTVPFGLESVDLNSDEANDLLRAGVFTVDDHSGRYRVPEIYRHSLGFLSNKRARVLRRPKA